MTYRLAIVAVMVGAIACSGGDSSPATPGASPGSATPTPAGSISIVFRNGDSETRLTVEVADDAAERAQGLMGRESLGEDAGMLFVWPEETSASFWMRDTAIPLSIAFIKADRTIVHVEDMAPLSDDFHTSPEPFRYAVEANQGWFSAHDIGVGDSAAIPIDVSSQGAR